MSVGSEVIGRVWGVRTPRQRSALRLRRRLAALAGLVITQSKALRYQIRLRSIPARTSSSLSGKNSLESGTESGKAGEVSMKVNVSSFLIW